MSKMQATSWTYLTNPYGNNRVMDKISRRILADNIARMVRGKDDSIRGKVRGWALANDLDVRKIDRAVKAEYSTTVDTLDEIAAAIGCQPWQLLVPNMDINNLPMLVMGDAEREIYSRLRALIVASNQK
jgi:hypothetical protein